MNIDLDSDEDADGSDSDFDYGMGTGDHNALYESRIQDFDELLFVRDSLNWLSMNQSSYYQRIMSECQANSNPQELESFNKVMNEIQQLIAEEKDIER